MAKNITVKVGGVQRNFSGIQTVEIPKIGGGKALFVDGGGIEILGAQTKNVYAACDLRKGETVKVFFEENTLAEKTEIRYGPHPNYLVTAVAFSNEKNMIAIAKGGDANLKFYDFSKYPVEEVSITNPPAFTSNNPTMIAFNNSGNLIYYNSGNNRYIGKIENDEYTQLWNSTIGYIDQSEFSPDDKWLLLSGEDTGPKLIDTETFAVTSLSGSGVARFVDNNTIINIGSNIIRKFVYENGAWTLSQTNTPSITSSNRITSAICNGFFFVGNYDKVPNGISVFRTSDLSEVTVNFPIDFSLPSYKQQVGFLYGAKDTSVLLVKTQPTGSEVDFFVLDIEDINNVKIITSDIVGNVGAAGSSTNQMAYCDPAGQRILCRFKINGNDYGFNVYYIVKENAMAFPANNVITTSEEAYGYADGVIAGGEVGASNILFNIF